MESEAMASSPKEVSRRRWISWLLGTSFGATLLAFAYPVLRYLVPPEASEPSLTEFELDIKASDIAPNSNASSRSAESRCSSSGRCPASSGR